MSNASRCKTYYQKIKADPERWKAFMEKRAAYKAGACEPCEPCEPSVSTPRKISPEERAALLAAFDEPAPSVAHLGGKHAAPPTVGPHDSFTPEQITEVYREHHAKQLPEPVPLADHPFINALRERIPCTLVKELEPKS